MALLSDDLSVWAIGFRWAGLDPDRLWFRIPLPVRDHFRNLMDAILKAELSCVTISLEKNPKIEPMFSVYHYLDDIEDCRHGLRFNRKLLRWALIERADLMLWCERRGMELPQFWFPAGSKLEYELPEDEVLPGHGYILRGQLIRGGSDTELDLELAAQPEPDQEGVNGGAAADNTARVGELPPDRAATEDSAASNQTESEIALRASQRAKIACQEIAKWIWKQEPDRTIASVVKDERIQKQGGGSYYVEATVREWIKVVAPLHVRQRRGRPPGRNGSED
jgi:hypothetical protein